MKATKEIQKEAAIRSGLKKYRVPLDSKTKKRKTQIKCIGEYTAHEANHDERYQPHGHKPQLSWNNSYACEERRAQRLAEEQRLRDTHHVKLRRNQWRRRFIYRDAVKRKAAQAERQMLATTSLKDLIH